MEDWIEVIRERLLEEEVVLPKDDWERFQEKLLRNKRQRQQKVFWLACSGIAAAVALVFVFVNRQPASDEIAPAPRIASEYNITHSPTPERIVSGKNHDKFSVSHPSIIILQDSLSISENIEESPVETVIPSVKDSSAVASTGKDFFYPFDKEEEKRPTTKKIRITSSVSGLNGSIANGSNALAPDIFGTDISSVTAASHMIPFSIGLGLSFMIRQNLAFTTGVTGSVYHSKFSGTATSVSQRAYYLGVPIRLDWITWSHGPVSTWIGAGGKVDHLVYGKRDSKKLTDNSFHWSVTGDMGIQYEVFPGIGIFFEPEVSYYFKPEYSAILTYRTENPLMFSLGAGLRFNF